MVAALRKAADGRQVVVIELWSETRVYELAMTRGEAGALDLVARGLFQSKAEAE